MFRSALRQSGRLAAATSSRAVYVRFQSSSLMPWCLLFNDIPPQLIAWALIELIE